MNPKSFLYTLLLACTVLLVGCVPESGETEPAHRDSVGGALPDGLADVAMARLQRLRKQDPLAVGRVVTIFDFEETAQVECFQKFGENSYDVRRISTAKAATGLSSLRVRLTADRSELAAVRSVPADWSESKLLRIEVFAETDVDGFLVRIRDREGRRADCGPFRLRPGWQAITVELERLASAVDLRRIARLAVAVASPKKPVNLWLDDLVLIDNRAARWPVYGNQRTVGYRISGRTLTVFGPAGFEVSFAPDDRGVYRLTQWNALTNRRRLLRSAPRAALLTIEPKIAPSLSGRHRIDRCRVIEMNRVRVRVRLERLYFDRYEQIAAGTAGRIAETYTIYGSGQIYGLHETRLGPKATVGELAVQLRTSETLRPAGGGSVAWMAHVDQRRGREAALLLAFGVSGIRGKWRTQHWPGRLSLSRVDLTLPGGGPGVCRLPFLLNLKPGAPAAMAAGVADYTAPLQMQFTRGRRSFTDPGDANQDGFNEAEGCHVIRADDEVVRFTLRARRGVRQSPVLKILNLKAASFLVNIGGRVTEVIARDGDGDPIAQIPGRLDRPVRVEITPATGTRHPILPEVW